MKRFVETVLSLNGKGHAYDFQVAEIILNKVHYNKKQHDINGFVLKKAESSQNTEASYLVDSVDYGFTDVHIPDAGQTQVLVIGCTPVFGKIVTLCILRQTLLTRK